MYKKVLLAIDGSENSLRAAQTVKQFLDNGLAEKAELIHVVPNLVNSYYDLGGDLVESISQLSVEKGQEILEAAKNCFGSDYDLNTSIRIGEVAETICEYAKNGHFDLIVVGSRGMNPLQSILVGSVSRRVIHFAPCPVLVVKP